MLHLNSISVNVIIDFIEILYLFSFGGQLVLVDWSIKEAEESDVRGYFLCCPLCGSNKLAVHITDGGRDTLTCYGCGAKWHLWVAFGLR